jgi:hypothetical protein
VHRSSWTWIKPVALPTLAHPDWISPSRLCKFTTNGSPSSPALAKVREYREYSPSASALSTGAAEVMAITKPASKPTHRAENRSEYRLQDIMNLLLLF